MFFSSFHAMAIYLFRLRVSQTKCYPKIDQSPITSVCCREQRKDEKIQDEECTARMEMANSLRMTPPRDDFVRVVEEAN
jgi:hypothetical protein